jgi:type I restriction enzyme S subunit
VYLAKQLGLSETARYYGRLANGSTRYGLSYQSIARTPIRLAPLPQQQRIAEILSTVDEAIEQTEALIAKTQQIKAGLIQDLFTRGVTADGQLRPPREEAPQLYKEESPLGWIPKEWDVRPLDKLADVNRGKFTIRPRNDPRYYNGQYPFIQTGDVALAGGRVLASYSQTLNSLGLGVSRLFPVGTIMVTIAANIGDTCILGSPMCAPDSLVGVVPNAGEVARFLELCIRRRKRWFENRAPQTAQKNINLDDLRPMLVPYPAPDEQSRIAERYEAIDAQLLENEEEATKLGMFKRGLMQDLLSGAVPVAVEHQPGRKEVAANV